MEIWMKSGSTILTAFLLSVCGGNGEDPEPSEQTADTVEGDFVVGDVDSSVGVPGEGQLYHGVFPGHFPSTDEEEDDVTLADVESYEEAAGQSVAWVYFSHNWYNGRTFPTATASWIREHGAVPFIRLMLRTTAEQDIAEPVYTLEDIAAGDFDGDLAAWGRAAAAFGTPLIVEFGTEVNGEWFSWNGTWNGGATTGPQRFRAAFRHIVEMVRDEGASNITWVFHVDMQDAPEEDWNRFENYYPGEDVVDWVGVSVYGAGEPDEDEWTEFRDGMDATVPRLNAMAPGKPVFVLEFGVTMGNPLGDAAEWADDALGDLIGGRWPSVRGFSWWNEMWENDDNPAHDTNMRVQDIPGMSAVFREHLASENVLGEPLLQD